MEGIMKELYPYIFKRKSFHLFRDNKTRTYYKDFNSLSQNELDEIYKIFKSIKPLFDDIRVDIRIEKTSSTRGEEYSILFYSEKKDGYLANIGYIGEILDLKLVALNIGTLWYGIGKTNDTYNGLSFITTMMIAKVPENVFRKDMFKSKRKALEEIYDGSIYKDILNIARFSPSSCNTQPWFVKENNNILEIYRYKKPGKRGIMPVERVVYQNLIDMGIFILFLSILFEYNNIKFTLKSYNDNENNLDEYNHSFDVIIDN